MSAPSKGNVSKVEVRSVQGGFIVSWAVFDETTVGFLQAAQYDVAVPRPTRTVERVCAGMPALHDLLSNLLLVQP